ncbi:putative disease resistance protein [Salvia divinorum]
MCSMMKKELKQLNLEELPKLKSLCKGTSIICNFIEYISITKCPRLMKKLPVLVDLRVPRRCMITVNPELLESLTSVHPNFSRFFSTAQG